MKIARCWFMLGLLSGILPGSAVARDAVGRAHWQAGPGVAALGHIAEIRIPSGYLFADGADARVLLERMHNPPSFREVGFLAPSDLKWFILFEYDRIGHVNPDRIGSPNADATLHAIRAGNARANRERRQRGWAPLHVMDWEKPPEVASSDGTLVWGLRGQVRGTTVLNWTTRWVGRGGVMRATLVTSPDAARDALPEYEDLLAGFSFTGGPSHADFRPGKEVASYGLTAMIAGGALAVTVKARVGRWIWRRIAGAFALTSAIFRKLLANNT